jgi:hypothetical protein
MKEKILSMLKIINKENFFIWTGIFIFTVYIHFKHYINYDEGLTLSIAQDIYKGKKLYLDIFSFVTPGSFYLIAGIWKIFGISYWSAKAAGIIAIFLSAIGVAKITSAIQKNAYSLRAALFFIISTSSYWPVVSYHTFNLPFLVWGIYFFIRSFSSRKPADYALSGIFTGLAIIFLQNTGVYLFGGLSLFFFILSVKGKKGSNLNPFLIFIMSSLLPVALLCLFWSPMLLFHDLVLFPFSNYSKVASVNFNYIYIVLFYLLICVLFTKKEKKLEYYLVFCMAIILLLSTTSLADYFHVVKLLFPVYALTPSLISSLKGHRVMIRYPFYALILGLAALMIYPCVYITIQFPPFYSVKNYTVLDHAREICAGSEYVYAGPFLSSYYFELRKKNPSPRYWLITNRHTREQFDEALRGIKEHQPGCVLLDYDSVEKYRYDKNNPVDEYIMRNYHWIETVGGISIYSKN